MGGLFSSPKKIAAPSPVQTTALAQQEAAVSAEEKRLAAEQEAEAATKRARIGRNAGRALLLDDELGVTGADGQPLATTLGR